MAKYYRTAKPHDARQRSLARQRHGTHDKDYHARQRRCRAILTKRTAKNPLPGSTLPCACCRAATHGKDFAVSSRAFAVRLARTAKNTIPVVSLLLSEKNKQEGGSTCRASPMYCRRRPWLKTEIGDTGK
jgi:hypothetical protein